MSDIANFSHRDVEHVEPDEDWRRGNKQNATLQLRGPDGIYDGTPDGVGAHDYRGLEVPDVRDDDWQIVSQKNSMPLRG
jgi:hypothetical protein